MKVSVVTAVLNRARVMEDCLRSVAAQSHADIEHVVVDGVSTDGTVEVLSGWEDARLRWTSEPDDGLYEAMNKGIAMATGDVVGILGSDDVYADERAVERAVAAMEGGDGGEGPVDSSYGDLLYVDAVDVERVIRYWKGAPYEPGRFQWGWMPPHPTFFARREVYERHGGFDPTLRISADYELMLRLLVRHGISTRYVPHVQVRMRVGGVSNRGLRSLWQRTAEDLRACRANGLRGGVRAVTCKKLRKLPQFFLRPA